jgi:hypothetical protein
VKAGCEAPALIDCFGSQDPVLAIPASAGGRPWRGAFRLFLLKVRQTDVQLARPIKGAIAEAMSSCRGRCDGDCLIGAEHRTSLPRAHPPRGRGGSRTNIRQLSRGSPLRSLVRQPILPSDRLQCQSNGADQRFLGGACTRSVVSELSAGYFGRLRRVGAEEACAGPMPAAYWRAASWTELLMSRRV